MWVHSFDGEYYLSQKFETKESAVQDAINEYDEDHDEFYVGEVVEFRPALDVKVLLELIKKDAFKRTGDSSIGYLNDVSRADLTVLDKRLSDVIHTWTIDLGYEADFFNVENVEHYTKKERNHN